MVRFLVRAFNYEQLNELAFVRITELGDHVCAPVPTVPQIPALKPPQSPRYVAALLPTKLQSLVNGPPPLQSPPRT